MPTLYIGRIKNITDAVPTVQQSTKIKLNIHITWLGQHASKLYNIKRIKQT